jgi:hypothetical protein
VELSNSYSPGAANLHVPSQPVAAGAGLTGTEEEHVGAAGVQAMFAATLVLSANVTSPPAAIVVARTYRGVAGVDVQHAHAV